jgi:hypothetical protein
MDVLLGTTSWEITARSRAVPVDDSFVEIEASKSQQDARWWAIHR